jgi:tRNA G10  N-methylase Trm11
VTSPPYANSRTEVDGEKGRRGGDSKQRVKKDYAGVSEDNIGHFPHGEVDAVITSPPYAHDSVVHKNERRTKVAKEKFGYSQFYSTSEVNIGNLKIDTVITSPPYEETQSFHDTDFMIKTAEDRSRHYKDGLSKGHFASAEAIKRSNKKLVSEYSNDPSNIGNLKKETYLEAMLKAYAEMFKVLKPNGLAVIIIKPFIRDKKVVDLPLQTWLLLERVGFRLVKLYKLRLKNPSFWRVLYRKKYPDVPLIEHEYVLVTRK